MRLHEDLKLIDENSLESINSALEQKWDEKSILNAPNETNRFYRQEIRSFLDREPTDQQWFCSEEIEDIITFIKPFWRRKDTETNVGELFAKYIPFWEHQEAPNLHPNKHNLKTIYHHMKAVWDSVGFELMERHNAHPFSPEEKTDVREFDGLFDVVSSFEEIVINALRDHPKLFSLLESKNLAFKDGRVSFKFRDPE